MDQNSKKVGPANRHQCASQNRVSNIGKNIGKKKRDYRDKPLASVLKKVLPCVDRGPRQGLLREVAQDVFHKPLQHRGDDHRTRCPRNSLGSPSKGFPMTSLRRSRRESQSLASSFGGLTERVSQGLSEDVLQERSERLWESAWKRSWESRGGTPGRVARNMCRISDT